MRSLSLKYGLSLLCFPCHFPITKCSMMARKAGVNISDIPEITLVTL